MIEPVGIIAEYKYLFVISYVLSVVLGMGTALVTDILVLRFGFNRRLSQFEVDTYGSYLTLSLAPLRSSY